jgi:hypothetical protein
LSGDPLYAAPGVGVVVESKKLSICIYIFCILTHLHLHGGRCPVVLNGGVQSPVLKSSPRMYVYCHNPGTLSSAHIQKSCMLTHCLLTTTLTRQGEVFEIKGWTGTQFSHVWTLQFPTSGKQNSLLLLAFACNTVIVNACYKLDTAPLRLLVGHVS